MRVLITRPEEDAARIAEILKSRGHEPVIAPLLQTNFHDGPEVSLDGVQAILATSANGVRALMRRTLRRDVPVFAVGPQTEEEARAHSFTSVRNANGDSRTLAAATQEWTSPEKGALLHVKGAEADGTLATLLKAQGFDVRTLVLYDVADVGLPGDARARLANGEIDAALFFSARSARIFKDAVADLPLETVMAVCISNVTAEALAPLTFRSVRVAAEPNQDSLLACLS
ncbi:MAG TPA: uroporphyrinogen-III synthase [Rhizomicrobium sp.]|nr:uroporphyrinogen-III synthase [Rhizomicrobium sp.]